eukprot:12882592-Prorocentrum_lima.AAC.1
MPEPIDHPDDTLPAATSRGAAIMLGAQRGGCPWPKWPAGTIPECGHDGGPSRQRHSRRVGVALGQRLRLNMLWRIAHGLC